MKFIIFTYNFVNFTYSGVFNYIYIQYVNKSKGSVTYKKLDYLNNEIAVTLNVTSENSIYVIEALTLLCFHMDYLQTVNGNLFNDKRL